MFLKSLKIKNFRSFWSDDTRPTVDIELSTGVNYFAGANNAGKSNLLRALALALDTTAHPYNADIDRPKDKRVDTQSTVTLEFAFDGKPKTSPEQTLLKYVDAYERTVNGFKEPSFASDKRIQFYVQAGRNQLANLFLANGTGSRRGDAEKLDAALEQFRNVVRFVDIRSGEDLQSLLQRRFKEVLGNVIAEENNTKIESARKARQAYVDSLTEVLKPLAEHVGGRIRRYVKDIEAIKLTPCVTQVEDAMVGAEFVVKDAVETALEQKGTGVRGAALLMLLSFIADSSRRAVVFAIEEPESFLHPEAHRALGSGLEDFAKRPDVTVLVTTHSPFIFRGEGPSPSSVFAVTKDRLGHSTVEPAAAALARTELMGSKVFAEFLRRADQVPDATTAVLVTEGWTDKEYIRIAAEILDVDLSGVEVVPADGASDAAFQAVTMRGLHGDRAIAVIFDDDDEGRKARDMLTKRNWQMKSQVLCYSHWVPPANVSVEAEDMFSNAMIRRFLSEVGETGNIDGRNLRPKTEVWHYSFTEQGKKALIEWARRNARPDELSAWKAMLDHLAGLVTRAKAAQARREAATPQVAAQPDTKPVIPPVEALAPAPASK